MIFKQKGILKSFIFIVMKYQTIQISQGLLVFELCALSLLLVFIFGMGDILLSLLVLYSLLILLLACLDNSIDSIWVRESSQSNFESVMLLIFVFYDKLFNRIWSFFFMQYYCTLSLCFYYYLCIYSFFFLLLMSSDQKCRLVAFIQFLQCYLSSKQFYHLQKYICLLVCQSFFACIYLQLLMIDRVNCISFASSFLYYSDLLRQRLIYQRMRQQCYSLWLFFIVLLSIFLYCYFKTDNLLASYQIYSSHCLYFAIASEGDTVLIGQFIAPNCK